MNILTKSIDDLLYPEDYDYTLLKRVWRDGVLVGFKYKESWVFDGESVKDYSQIPL